MKVKEIGSTLRFEGTLAEIQALNLSEVPINSTFWATDVKREYGVKTCMDGLHLYLSDGKMRPRETDISFRISVPHADDYAVGSTGIDEDGKRYFVRVGSKGDYEWVPEKAAPAPVPEAAQQPAETKTAPVLPAMKVQSDKPTYYGAVRPDPTHPALLPVGTRFIMTTGPLAFVVTQHPHLHREWTQVRCGFEGTFAELVQLNSSGTQFPVGMTFDATDIGRKFVVKQLDNALGATRVFCLDDGRHRLSWMNAVFKFTSANTCEIGSTAVDDEGKRYVVSFNSEGDHCWRLLDCTPAKSEQKKASNSAFKGMAAKSDKPTLHALWDERPSVSDLPAGTRFIATDSLAACEIVSMPHAGREWVSIPCRFHGTVAEMLAMSPDELPVGMLFQCFEEKRNYSVIMFDGKKFWEREDGKVRSGSASFRAQSLALFPADDHIVGSTMTCETGGKYVVKLNAEGEHEWVLEQENVVFRVLESLPKPDAVGNLVHVDHELFVCCERKPGELKWVKVSSAKPEPRFSVYVLWSHQGWALAADDLDEDQAEAKRADVIRSEYDDDHEQILAVEVFPMGTTPGQLGVPPKEIT